MPDLPSLEIVSENSFGDDPDSFDTPTFWKSVCTKQLQNKVDLLNGEAFWASDRFCANHLQYDQQERSNIPNAEDECIAHGFLPLKYDAAADVWSGNCATKSQFRDFEGPIPKSDQVDNFELAHVSEKAFMDMKIKQPFSFLKSFSKGKAKRTKMINTLTDTNHTVKAMKMVL